MYKKYLLSILILKLLFSGYCVHSQDKIKFGRVSSEEIEMTTYESDPSASAVVLYDKGHFSKEGKFTRHRRIKILKKSGTPYANLSLNVPNKGNLKGMVYNLENGEIVKERLISSSIYQEEVFDGFYIYKIFLPNVRIGSIIDIEYSHIGIPFEWRFQELIPVAYSEITLEPSEYAIYKKQQRGFEPVLQVEPNKYVAQNVPAFVQEPHVNHYSNYITKFEFQLARYDIPGFYMEISTSWPIISKRMMNNLWFGNVIRNSNFLKEEVEEWELAGLSNDEKILKAYNHIQSQITWNKQNRLYVSDHYVRKLNKDLEGSSADINLMLLSVLNNMNIEAYPVVLSTRSNGILNPHIPNMWQLNYVVAATKYKGKEILLDASQKNLIPGVLPEKCLNGKGWLITGVESGRWVDLLPRKSSEKRQMISIVFEDDGSILASVNQRKTMYDYMEWSDKFKNAGSPERYKLSLEDENKIDLRSYELKSDNDKKLTVTESVVADITENSTDLGNELILNPFVLNELTRNPFRSENRLAPVDLSYPRKYITSISVSLPDYMLVKSLPEPIVLQTPNGGMKFQLNCSQLGNKINIQSNFEISRTVYSEAEYAMLKEVYSLIIERLNQPIHLNKKT